MLRITETRATYGIRRAYDLMAKAIVPGSRKHLPPAPRLAVIPTDYLGVSIIGNGIYERREIELLRILFGACDLQATTFLDIGGNIGNHSVSLAASFTEVVAFEPNPPIASLFKTNLLLSGAGNVRLHEVGLGREDAELRFSLLQAGNDGSGSFASGKGEIVLPVRHGDRYLAQNEPEIASGAKRIGFVKCDVEGFEADVFAGLRETFARHRPILTFESNHKPDGEKAWAELRAAGYDTLSCLRETGDDGSRPLQEIKRLILGYSCWAEEIRGIPERRCNLIASFGPLEPAA
jgi:FkbM family methyltransferase